jgi:uncharacterized protein YjbI with pentapeptide repeats
LCGARLDDAVFRNARLTEARFVNAVVQGADFSGALDLPDHLRKMLDAKR